METALNLTALYFIAFSLAMFIDSWRYSNPLWFLYLVIFSLFPTFLFLQFFYSGTIFSLVTSLFRTGCNNRPGELFAMLAIAFIPFFFSLIYYSVKYKSHLLSSKRFFIPLFFLLLMLIIGLTISS